MTLQLTKAERDWIKEKRPEFVEDIKGYNVKLKTKIGGATRLFTLGIEYAQYKQLLINNK